MEKISASLAMLGIVSLFCQWLGWKLRLPAILPLLVAGLLLGPALGVLNPDALFGDLLFPIISLGVAVILFEGSLTLNFKEIKSHGRMVTSLVTVGAGITWATVSLGAYLLVGFSWEIAMLFGALVVVTGPTVIMPMLRSVRPSSKLASILRWEGIVIDPLGALLAVLVFEYIAFSSVEGNHVLTALALMLSIGFGLGALSGYLVGIVLRKNMLPHYLQNVAVLTIVLAVFVGSNLLQEESGLLTVTVMGIWLANMRGVDIADILEFKETLTVLLISALFILLAARLDSNAMLDLGWGGLATLLVVMFIARPLSIWISGIGSSLNNADKWFLSWVAPRGIVAAAVSSLFAIKLESLGYEGAEKIVPLVFLVIIGTVVIQSLTAAKWAKWLGVSAGSNQGILMFGASRFARDLAKVLQARQFRVVLADTNWDSIRLARMDNIPVYFGNPASEHAETYLDLTGIGRVFIISPYRQLNPLVNFHFQDVYGMNKVFGLNSSEPGSSRHQMSETYVKQLSLFGEQVSYAKLSSLVAKGAIIKTTNITDSFTYQHFINRYGDGALPLLYIKDRKLHVITANTGNAIPVDVELVSLIAAHALQEPKEHKESKESKEIKESMDATAAIPAVGQQQVKE